jgi:hypothetical protein
MLSRAGPTWTEAEVDAAKAAGVGARAEFDDTLLALRAGLTNLDPLEVLARTALSLTFRIATMQFESDKKGVEVFHVEVLQALACRASDASMLIATFPRPRRRAST